jgi:UDP-glucose 4-epimerase
MLAVVTGGFGFIGSNLVRELLLLGYEVKVIDDFSTGDRRFLSVDEQNSIDILDIDLCKTKVSQLSSFLKDADIVFHLAANADVRGGFQSPFRDLESNVIATLNLLEAMRQASVPRLVFSSTGCVYGDTHVHPTSENYSFPIQTSLYGSSKVAAEGLVSTYAAQGIFKATCYRFVSILGQNYHHGHVIDNPKELPILGNGQQKKSYLDVQDCITAMISIQHETFYEVYNLGNVDYISVLESASIISSTMNVSPQLKVGHSPRGWIGDNPFTFLDITKASSAGWTPKIPIVESIKRTVDFLLQNPWVVEKTDYRLSKM